MLELPGGAFIGVPFAEILKSRHCALAIERAAKENSVIKRKSDIIYKII
jgi:hypothetical protein